MKKIFLILLLSVFSLTGCASSTIESGKNPINRSILFDTNLDMGVSNLPFLPFPLPTIHFGIGFHARRLSPEEEVELELAKKGRYKGDVGTKPPLVLPPTGPSPSKATE